MTDETGFILGGFALLAGWSALARYRGSLFLTLLLRVCAAATISLALYLALPSADAKGLETAVPLYLMFVALPVAVAAFAFGAIRRAFGTTLSVGAMTLASLWFGFAFKKYLEG